PAGAPPVGNEPRPATVWTETVHIPADAAVRAARITLPAPAPGVGRLRLTLTADGVWAANSYEVEVGPARG
ncbi:MAG TPA: hypothetical protein DEP69_02365, partial [Acidimicrobiaceae bacterium]|nr:hypothetical protein [Acidimicrobiaceae bacterium]